MKFNPSFIYNILDKSGKVTFQIRGVENMPPRFRNALVYNNQYYPDWFKLKNNTVTIKDVVRIYNTPNLLAKTPNIAGKTLKEIKDCVKEFEAARGIVN